MIDKSKMVNALKEAIELFMKKHYQNLYSKDFLKRHTVTELQLAIDEYPGELSYPPENAFDILDVYEINVSEANIDFELWFDNERSDLTLGLYIKETDHEIFYGIQGIHVL